jgi:hypothetical protein
MNTGPVLTGGWSVLTGVVIAGVLTWLGWFGALKAYREADERAISTKSHQDT